MITVVIPVKNEAERIYNTLNNCLNLPVDYIIPVLNGCNDSSKERIKEHPLHPKIKLLEFIEPLGIDMPRAIGAAYAYKLKAKVVLFLDGDMQGNIREHLKELIEAILKENIDMALTNCYPFIYNRSSTATRVIYYREKLNRSLGLFSKLGLAIPSHGPHAVSRKLLNIVPWYSIAIPPLSLAIAHSKKLNIKVATKIPHKLLLSPLRNDEHCDLIAETIIGDCLQALRFWEGSSLSRKDKGKIYMGYHQERKFNILSDFLITLELTEKK